MQTLYVTEAVMLYRKNYLNTTEYYDVSEYANIVKNYIICFLFVKFRLCQRDFHKKIGLSVKGNHDRAEKYIDLFKGIFNHQYFFCICFL